MSRRTALDGAGQLFQLGRERLKLGNQNLRVELGKVCRRIEQRVQHHRDAWKDRFLDSIERLFKTDLSLLDIAHGQKHAPQSVKKR